MNSLMKNTCVLGIVSFILHFVWEYWQCGIFYVMSGASNDRLMLSATFGDMMMSIILFLLLSLAIYKDPNWILKRFDNTSIVISTLYALFLSFYFEVHALFTNRWAYSDAMPLFLNTNIGLIPVIQLVILFPLTFVISRFLLNSVLRKKS